METLQVLAVGWNDVTEGTAHIALVHVPVLEGLAPAIYVARRESSMLFVGGPGFTGDDPSCFRPVPIEVAFELDETLSEVGTLAVGQCACRQDPTEPWSYGAIPNGSTFLIRYEARPSDSNPERHDVGGAIVNCWIVTDTMESALHISAAEVSQCGWVIVEQTHSEHTTTQDYGANPLFRQAQVDGLVLRFHTFPRDELDFN